MSQSIKFSDIKTINYNSPSKNLVNIEPDIVRIPAYDECGSGINLDWYKAYSLYVPELPLGIDWINLYFDRYPDFLNPQSIVHSHDDGEKFYEMRHGEKISNTSIVNLDGYEGGSISFDNIEANGSNIRASVSPARVKTYELTLASLPVGVESYTITRTPSLTGAADTQSFTVPGTSGKPIIYYGDTLTVSVVTKPGFNPAESSFSNLTNNRVVGPSTLTVTSGGPKQFSLKVSGFGTQFTDCGDPYNTIEGLDSITISVFESPYANVTGPINVQHDGTIPVYYGDKIEATVYTFESHNGSLNWTTYEVGNAQPTELIATVAIKTFTVEFKPNNSSWGSVSTPKIEKVPYGSYIHVDENNLITIDGSSIVVTATAATDTAQYDYEFSNWSNTTGQITSDRVVKANFTETVKNYTVTITRNNSNYGSIIGSTSIVVPYGTTWIADNSNKTLTLNYNNTIITAKEAGDTAQYDYSFVNWTWSSSTAEVKGNVTITANFKRELQKYTVSYPAIVDHVTTFKIYHNGTLIKENPTTAGSFVVSYGDKVYVTAISETGFKNPSVGGVGTSASLATEIKKDTTITLAPGAVKTYTLTFTGLDEIDDPGCENVIYESNINYVTITRKTSPLLGPQTTEVENYKWNTQIEVYHGDILEATVTADTGYKASLSWYTHTVSDNVVLNASASLITFTLSYPAKPSTVSSYYISRTASPYAGANTGTIVTGGSSAGQITVYYGDKLSIAAYAAEGYLDPTYSLSATTVLSDVTATVTGGSLKGYQLSYPAIPVGVSSYTITRTESPYAKASIGVIVNSPSSASSINVNYGDKLTIQATAHEAYQQSTYYFVFDDDKGAGSQDIVVGIDYDANIAAVVAAGDVKEYTLTVNGFHTPGLNSISVKVNKSPYKGWTGTHTLTHDDNIKLYYGDEITASISTHEAYTGSLNWTSKTINSDATLTGTSTIKTYKLTMGSKPTGVNSYTVSRTSSPNGGAAAGNLSNGATLYYGDVLTASATAQEGYTNPSLNWTSWSKVTSDVISSVTAGTIKEFKLTISSKPTGVATHTVTRTGSTLKGASNGNLTNGATIYYGDQLTAAATPSTGYNNPKLNWTSNTKVTGDVTSTATAGSVKTYILTLAGFDEIDDPACENVIHESNINYVTITRKSSPLLGAQVTTTENYAYNTQIVVYHGDELTATVVADTGYNASLSWTSKTVTENLTLTGSATIKKFTVTFNTNNAHGTIDKNSISDVPYGSYITVNNNKVTINGTTVTATPKADTAQYDYEFSSWSNTTGTITANRTITANFADPKVFNYTVTIQTVYGTASPTSITVPYGTTWSVSGNTLTFSDGQKSVVTPNTNTAQYSYAFSSWSPASGTVTGNTTITGTCSRTLRSYTISYPAKPTGVATFNIYLNGTAISKTDAAGSFTAKYGDKVYATATAATGYYAPNVSGVTTSSVEQTVVNENKTIVVNPGSVLRFTLDIASIIAECDVVLLEGVASISVERTSSPLQNASTGNLATVTEMGTSVTVYYGDVLKATATGATGYNASPNWTTLTVTGAPTALTASAVLKTYTLTIVNGSYGTVKRGSTTLSNGATITHFDTLTITPTAATGYTTTASPNGTITVDGNETVTFTRTGNTYYVYYNKGLSTGGTLPGTQSRTYPNATTISSNSMTKSNTSENSYTVAYAQGNASNTTNLPSTQTSTNTISYTANGWTTGSSNVNDRDYANGASFSSASNLTLYPNFTTSSTNNGVTTSSNTMSKNNSSVVGYTVSYNKGTATHSFDTCDDEVDPIVPNAQTVFDTIKYTHSGWATSASGSKAYGKGASTGALTQNITLYPYFDSSTTKGSVTLGYNEMYKTETGNGSYTVTYNYNGGSGSPTSATASRVVRYTANGWTTTSGSTTRSYTDGQTITPSGNITLYPCFSQTNHTYSITLPTPSARTGYTFKGWSTSSTATSGSTGSYTPTGNVTLYAVWVGNTYTVTYNKGLSTGGTLPTSPQNRTYPNATTIATNSMTKSNTTQTGYTLSYAKGVATSGTLPSSTSATDTISYTANGWTTGSSNTNDPDYANGASFGKDSTANLTLYPNFTTSLSRGSVKTGTNSMTKSNGSSNSYTVTYNKGTATYSFDECDDETTPIVPSTQTSTNTIKYTANGWSTGSSNTNDPDYGNGATISNFSSNLTLYPNFTTSSTNNGVTLASSSNLYKEATYANSYTVTYNQGNASSTTNLPSKQTSQNKTTYTSDGWTTTSGSTTRTYANGASTGALTANLTLYPCFKQSTSNQGVTLSSNTMSKSNTTANGYTVTYKQGSATSTTVPSAQTQTNTTTYTHGGWATSASGSKAYNKGAATGALSANLNLYPYFSSSTTNGSITLASNSMTKSNTTDSSYTVTYNYNGSGASNTSAAATVTRSYSANGWTTTSGSTTRNYTNGQTITPTGNITLYPCFSQSTSGGSVTLPTPSRTGYTFNGWYTAASGGTKIGAGGASYKPSANITLYAQWTVNSYTLTIAAVYDEICQDPLMGAVTGIKVERTSCPSGKGSTGVILQGGVGAKTTTVYYGDVLKATATADTGYTATPSWTSLTVTGTPTTLTASATVNKYTISFGVSPSGYGSVSPTSVANVPYGSSFSVSGNKVTINGTTVTATPASTTAQYSYAFSSWSNTTMITGAKTVTANFTRTTRTYSVSYPAKPTGVASFIIYKNGTAVVSNPSSASSFTATYGDKIYATASAATNYAAPSISGVGTSSSAATTVTGAITIKCTAGAMQAGWRTILNTLTAAEITSSGATKSISISGLRANVPTKATFYGYIYWQDEDGNTGTNNITQRTNAESSNGKYSGSGSLDDGSFGFSLNMGANAATFSAYLDGYGDPYGCGDLYAMWLTKGQIFIQKIEQYY